MLLSLIEFTDYSETVFSINSHWVFSFKSSLYYHKVWEAIFALFLRMVDLHP